MVFAMEDQLKLTIKLCGTLYASSPKDLLASRYLPDLPGPYILLAYHLLSLHYCRLNAQILVSLDKAIGESLTSFEGLANILSIEAIQGRMLIRAPVFISSIIILPSIAYIISDILHQYITNAVTYLPLARHYAAAVDCFGVLGSAVRALDAN